MKPITLFHFQQVLQNAKQIWSLKRSRHYGIVIGCHHGASRAQQWHFAVTCKVTVAIVKTIAIVAHLPYQTTPNGLILGLCNIIGWWRWHRSHTSARFGRNFMGHITYLSISSQGRQRFKLSYRSNYQQPVEFKIVRGDISLPLITY